VHLQQQLRDLHWGRELQKPEHQPLLVQVLGLMSFLRHQE
jgi:hypothetical protein